MTKMIGTIACLISAVASIAIGLMALGVDVLTWPLLKDPQILRVIQYIVGASGLVGFLTALMGHSGDCKMQK